MSQVAVAEAGDTVPVRTPVAQKLGQAGGAGVDVERTKERAVPEKLSPQLPIGLAAGTKES